MKRTLAVGIISLSDKTIDVLKNNGIYSLQELLSRRDSGSLYAGRFDGESYAEIQEACKSIDSFNASLKKNLFPDNEKQQPDSSKDKDETIRLKTHPMPLRIAVLELFRRAPTRKLNIAEIERILISVFGDDYSEDYTTIGATLVELANDGVIEKVDDAGYYRLIKKPFGEEEVIYPFDDMSKPKFFLNDNIGKEIEFRYKTSRAGSEKRWRRVKVYGQNDKLLYTNEYYPSGRRISYQKERIIEYRTPQR